MFKKQNKKGCLAVFSAGLIAEDAFKINTENFISITRYKLCCKSLSETLDLQPFASRGQHGREHAIKKYIDCCHLISSIPNEYMIQSIHCHTFLKIYLCST